MARNKYKIDKEFSAFALIRALANPKKDIGNKTETSHMETRSFDGEPIKCLIITPRNFQQKNAPCLIYFHGGAFRMQAKTYQIRMAHRYAYAAKCKVVFVNYRLAPEHPFPAAVEDAYSALKWVHKNATLLGIDINKIAVGGDSAGGTLAAVVSQMARDRSGPHICFQLMIYPVTDCDMQTESMKKFNDTPIWDSIKSKDMWKSYLRNGYQDILAYASPIKAESLTGLPPAYIETAEFDCLRDEGINYARHLVEAGVSVELVETKGTIHAYDMVFKSIAMKNFEKRVAALTRAFGFS